MSFGSSKDGIEVCYKDCRRNAQPIMFHPCAPLSSDDWDAQPRNKSVRIHSDHTEKP